VHNETASLVRRTLGTTPPFRHNKYYELELASLAKLAKRSGVVRWARRRVVKGYGGALRRRYEKAMESLNVDGGVDRRDKSISAFLKAEKFNPLAKPSKPRMIMARTPRFNLELSSYLKPLEHFLWDVIGTRREEALSGRKSCSDNPTRQVGKGLNAVSRARILEEKMENIPNCVVFEVDGKAFEAHVSQESLMREHAIYMAAYKGDRNLKRLLDTQLVLKGRTDCGIKFRRDGARASGDFNTGMGNTLIMLACCRAALRLAVDELKTEFRYDILADGDNCLIFVENTSAEWLHENFARLASTVCEQELAVESPVRNLSEVVFGQSRPCLVGSPDGITLPDSRVFCKAPRVWALGRWTWTARPDAETLMTKVYRHWRMVRDPLKTLSYSYSSYRHYNHYEKHGRKVLKAVSQCELALSRGVPVLQSYFAEALSRFEGDPDLKNPQIFLEGRLLEAAWALGGRVQTWEVTEDARRTFEEAWGISREEQIQIERDIKKYVNFPRTQECFALVEVQDGPDGGDPRSIEDFLGELY